MSDGNGALPEGWEPIALADVIDIRNGYAFKSKAFQKSGVPLVRQSNLAGDTVDLDSAVCLPPEYLQEYERFSLNQGDILIGMSGSIGKLCIYDKPQTSLQNQRTGKIDFLDDSAELRGFLWFYLQTVQRRLEEKGKGIGVQNVSGRDITSLNLKLPPLPEQRRIVSKIESLQERSSRARDALSEVGPLLEQFRQSVLRAAFSGRLTADWREQNPDVEPASELLQRIRTERRHRWEQSELAKYQAKGKTPPRNWKEKYKEPEPVDDTELSELPNGWCWARIIELPKDEPNSLTIGPFGSNLKVKDYTAVGVPLVFVREIRAECFGDARTKYVSENKAKELNAHKVRAGDLLITKMGDPPGDTAIYPPSKPDAVITADCIRITPDKELTSSSFLKYWLRAQPARDRILDETKGVAQRKLSLKRFREISIPLPHCLNRLRSFA